VLEIGSTVLGVDDFARAFAFWTAALDYVARDGTPEPEAGFAVLVPRSGPGPRLSLDQSGTPAPKFPRSHLDLYATDGEDGKVEIARLEALGATRVDWPFTEEDDDFVVLADTEGNRFCVVAKG
jgi:catechol 2,3-dioxygenase-like lactoylglutathione lyase family enzyme